MIGFRGDEEAVPDSGGMASAVGAEEGPVTAADRHWTDHPLGDVIVDVQEAFLAVAGKGGPPR